MAYRLPVIVCVIVLEVYFLGPHFIRFHGFIASWLPHMAVFVFVATVLACIVLDLAHFVSRKKQPNCTQSPLGDPAHDIRMVEILPARPSEELRCEINHGSWFSSQYEALSYTWECERRRTEGCWVGDKVLNLTPTLRRALLDLRREDQSRRIWIDAISINQNDKDEKSIQVAQMTNIYKNAQNVVVWLDVDSWNHLKEDCIRQAFDAIRECTHTATELATSEVSIGEISDENIASTLKTIMHMRWWDRIWIIQEVVCNKQVTVQCRD